MSRFVFWGICLPLLLSLLMRFLHVVHFSGGVCESKARLDGKTVVITGRVGSGRVGLRRVGSGRVGSGRVGSGRVGSGRVGSGQVGSGRVRSGASRWEDRRHHRSYQGLISRGIHGLPKALLGPAMPWHSMPCGRPTTPLDTLGQIGE
jgi:hypothetical protein